VSLALALSEWRNGVKQDETRQVILNNIIKEIEDNKADLMSKIDYHRDMSIKLGSYANSDSLWRTLRYNTGVEAVMLILDNGMRNPNLQVGAWKSAEISGVVNSFDYRTIYALSNLYRLQEEGPTNTWKKLIELFGDPYFFENDQAKTLVHMMHIGFFELYKQEQSLLSNYDYTLKQLKKE
ncbi:MAG: hypothetical protein AAF391_11120, partial [Bacteroidota bacterium]